MGRILRRFRGLTEVREDSDGGGRAADGPAGIVDPETGRWRVTAFVTPRLDPGGDQWGWPSFPVSPTGARSAASSGSAWSSTPPVSSAPSISNPIRGRRDPIPRCGGRCSPASGRPREVPGSEPNTVASFPAPAVSGYRTTYAAWPRARRPVSRRAVGPLAVCTARHLEMRRRDLEGRTTRRRVAPVPAPAAARPVRRAVTSTGPLDPPTSGSASARPSQALGSTTGPARPTRSARTWNRRPRPRPALDFHAFVVRAGRLSRAAPATRAGPGLPDRRRRPAAARGPDPVCAVRRAGRVARTGARPAVDRLRDRRPAFHRPAAGARGAAGRRVAAGRGPAAVPAGADRPRRRRDETGQHRADRGQHQERVEETGHRERPASMTPDAATLPALRGAGLTLYRDRRAGRSSPAGTRPRTTTPGSGTATRWCCSPRT